MITASSEEELQGKVQVALKALGVSEPVKVSKKGLFRVDITSKFGGLIPKFHNMSYGKNIGKFYIAIPYQTRNSEFLADTMTIFTGDVYDKFAAIARHQL